MSLYGFYDYPYAYCIAFTRKSMQTWSLKLEAHGLQLSVQQQQQQQYVAAAAAAEAAAARGPPFYNCKLRQAGLSTMAGRHQNFLILKKAQSFGSWQGHIWQQSLVCYPGKAVCLYCKIYLCT